MTTIFGQSNLHKKSNAQSDSNFSHTCLVQWASETYENFKWILSVFLLGGGDSPHRLHSVHATVFLPHNCMFKSTNEQILQALNLNPRTTVLLNIKYSTRAKLRVYELSSNGLIKLKVQLSNSYIKHNRKKFFENSNTKTNKSLKVEFQTERC